MVASDGGLDHTVAIGGRDDRQEAIAFEREQMRKFTEARRTPTPLELQEVATLVEKHMDGWFDRYPQFLEQYRRTLLEWGRLRSAAVVVVATRETLGIEAVLVFRSEETPSGSTPRSP